MNCQVPHTSLASRASRKKQSQGVTSTGQPNEDKFPFNGRITCPRIGFRRGLPFDVIKPAGDPCRPLQIDLTEHQSLPSPLFLPTTGVKCGKGPNPINNLDPQEQSCLLLESHLTHECRLLMHNEKGLTLKGIRTAWNSYKGKRLPSNMNIKSFQTIAERYASDEVLQRESFVGGNLAFSMHDTQRYLIHSVMEQDCTLCLTWVNLDDLENRPVNINTKLPIDGGMIYQIAVPRKSISWNPIMAERCDGIFATRQLHATRLWKIQQSEADNSVVLKSVQEHHDTQSTVRCVDLNPYIVGECCELLSKAVMISQDGLLNYSKELDEDYRSCFYMSHPKTILLTSAKTIDVIDTRCDSRKAVNQCFSIENTNVRTYFNISQTETIKCHSPSLRDHVSFLATEANILVWDLRGGNNLLSRMAHLMDSPPSWISSIPIGADKEWIFMDAQSPSSSGVMGLSWSGQDLTLNKSKLSSYSVPVASVEIEPQTRFTACDTLDFARKKGLGLIDWSVSNRIKQSRSGMVCCKDQNDNVYIWNCTVAGDVFVQQLDLNRRIGPSQQILSREFTKWISQWMDVTAEVEETHFSPDPVDQTELFDAESTLKHVQSSFAKSDVAGYLKASQTASIFPSRYGIPSAFEQNCPLDLTDVGDERGTLYNKEWEDQDSPAAAATGNSILEDTFSANFQDYFISSTPMRGMMNAASVPLASHLLTSTPLLPFARSDGIKMPKPLISSTPRLPDSQMSQRSEAGSSKSQRKAQTWDDF